MPVLVYGHPKEEVGRHSLAGFGEIYYIDMPRGYVKIINDFKKKWMAVETFPLIGRKFVHIKMAPALMVALLEIRQMVEIDSAFDMGVVEGQVFNPRHVWRRKDKPLSRHAFGLAIDFNPWENLPGVRGAIPMEVVRVFEKNGFVWGGRWRLKDDMHFQIRVKSKRVFLPA